MKSLQGSTCRELKEHFKLLLWHLIEWNQPSYRQDSTVWGLGGGRGSHLKIITVYFRKQTIDGIS